VTLTTAPSSGCTLRLVIVCRAFTTCAAATIGSNRKMRHGGMRAAAIDLDFENVERRHHRAGLDGELSGRQFGPVVHAENGFDGIFLQYTLLDHQSRSALILLGGLEDEMDRPGEIPCFCEVLGGAQQHRGMAVMTAGMHAAALLRDMREFILFLDVQSVHVGTQGDCTVTRHRSFEGADHTGSGDAALDGYPEGLEALRDQLGGLVFLEGGFWMDMDLMPPLGLAFPQLFRRRLCGSLCISFYRGTADRRASLSRTRG
jgi:hypothetical protein